MNTKKTTTNLDNETYYFLYHIALIQLDKNNILFNKLYDIIHYVLKEIKVLIDENKIDFNDPHLLKFINHTEYSTIFLTLSENEIKIIDTFKNKINIDPKIKIKRNQIIKTIIIYYYKTLI